MAACTRLLPRRAERVTERRRARMQPMKSVIIVTILGLSALAQASPRRAQSGPLRTSLVELYTSEGCSSCPPADALVNAQTARTPPPYLALAFHVDYWDEIGWPDRFASPRWSARQRARSASVYTPEVLRDGREIDRDRLLAPSEPARAQLELALDGANATVQATGGRRVYLAVTESGLVVNVGAGENRGRTLRHDHVVRELYGPVDANHPLQQTIAIAPEWNRAQLALVAFVEDERGEVLNAVQLPFDSH
jgi:hypothetical protein